MALSPEELERYARHIVVPEVGGPGQAKLINSKVLVIGAGGLGAPALLYLAAAGVGTIGICDNDTVSLSNLQRQVVHTTARVGEYKTTSARLTLEAINPHPKIIEHRLRLDTSNALDIIQGYDIVADGCDNFPTRFLVSDACYFAKKPLVFGALGPFDGYVSTFKPHEKSASGEPFPSYRCLFPEAPPPGLVANCAEVGVLGAVAGVIGTLMATEVLKEITGAGESLAGRLLLYDAKDARFDTVKVGWDPHNALSGEAPTIHDLSCHASGPAGTACAAP